MGGFLVMYLAFVGFCFIRNIYWQNVSLQHTLKHSFIIIVVVVVVEQSKYLSSLSQPKQYPHSPKIVHLPDSTARLVTCLLLYEDKQ